MLIWQLSVPVAKGADVDAKDLVAEDKVETDDKQTAAQVPVMDNVADLIFSGEEEGDQHYSSVAGDIDGDGYDDLIIGALQGWSSKPGRGRAYLYYGGPDMDNVPDLIFEGETGTTGCFGYVLGCGDIDNDGYDDITVAAHLYNGGARRGGDGRMYLYWGSRRRHTDAVADHIWDRTNGEIFGVSWNDRVMEDIDGDGYADIIVTAAGSKGRQDRAYLYWGNEKANFDSNCDLIFDCPDTGINMYGMGIACGDIDNDGYREVVIGAMFYPAPPDRLGRAYLYWGDKKEKMDGTCDFVFDAKNLSDRGFFGGNIGIADVDNDAYEDVVIGAFRYGNDKGRAYLYWGNNKALFDTTPDIIFTGEHEYNLFGDLAICGGDVNKDGFADILIGSRIYDNQRGRAYLYLGDEREKMDNIADKVFTGENQVDWFSDPPGSCFGDFNNDGYDDLAIGARKWPGGEQRGRVYLYYSSPTDNSNTSTETIGETRDGSKRTEKQPKIPTKPNKAIL